MKTPDSTHDVVVADAGAGGICTALPAARNRARVLLLEKLPAIGGLAVQPSVGLICKFHASDHRPGSPRLTCDEVELAATCRRLFAADPLQFVEGDLTHSPAGS